MEPLAHSARPELGVPSQRYAEHVSNVIGRATENAESVARFCPDYGAQLVQAVSLAAEFHDLGKLDDSNQKVLTSGSVRGALPVNHVDAGVAYIFQPTINNLLAATLIYAHHIGLPDFQDQRNNKAGYVLRDASMGLEGKPIKEITDEELPGLLGLHMAAFRREWRYEKKEVTRLSPLLIRIALSCLVDADHYDTARHYGEGRAGGEASTLHALDRLELLDAHVNCLARSSEDERTTLRNEIYQACKAAPTEPSMFACDSPVGTGKTTAIMSHLLRAAAEKGLRRIFVILPFTNIIDQSVAVYRKALVRPGERPEDVVAAHHHRAEFEDKESRHFAFLWEAPVVVTTAVQFFETIASNHPAALRKLHQVPGSAVLIDEAHAALPSHLWPQAWQWLRELESKWGCHFVLGSGSLNRFWVFEEFSVPPLSESAVPELISQETRSRALKHESRRVRYRTRADVLGLDELIAWITELEGPRLLIVNTVQSAAVIAAEIVRRFGQDHVGHLSTSLCPRDRRATLARIKTRLENQADADWTLVATSCVEAGVDLSFHTALRERCSLNSLVQIGGRVNRNGEYPDAVVWDVQLRHDELLRPHPAFDIPARVLGELFAENRVDPQCCTEAMRREIRQYGFTTAMNDRIAKAEGNLQFPTVAEKFKVIDSNTVTAVVDREFLSKLESGQRIDPNLLQDLSVQIWWHRKEEWASRPVDRFPGLYAWTLDYDNFLGYMAGVLQVLRLKRDSCSIV